MFHFTHLLQSYIDGVFGGPGILILYLLGIILFWLVLREIVCWYYKINERISLQKHTNYLLEQLLSKLDPNSEIPNLQSKANAVGTAIANSLTELSNDELDKIVSSYKAQDEASVLGAIALLRSKGIGVPPSTLDGVCRHYNISNMDLWGRVNSIKI